MDEGNVSNGGLTMIAVLVAVAILAICTGLVLDKAADYKVAAAEQAWAHAAQVNAQANLVDARTAQIGTVATAMAGMVVPMIVMLCIAAIVAGVFLYIDHRNQARYMALRESQLHYLQPGGYLGEETELYVPNARTRTRASTAVVALSPAEFERRNSR